MDGCTHKASSLPESWLLAISEVMFKSGNILSERLIKI